MLARPVASLHEEASVDVVVVAVAGGRRYAVEIGHVRQVVRAQALSRLPASGSDLVGLVPVQGEAMPVADLATVLGLAAADPTRPLALVLAGDHHPPVGLLVDEVITTSSLPGSEVRAQHAPDGAGTTLERGIAPDGVVLLDGAALLADPRLRVPLSTSTPQTDPDPHATERQP